MQLDQNRDKPIFLQFAEEIEDGILRGIFPEETAIPSINEAAVRFKINPATANRGVNLLVDEDIVYKKRGIGMFVRAGARDRIIAKRRAAFYQSYVAPMLGEAKKLGLTQDELIAMIEGGDHSDHD
ncbi:MAG: GntR family transcriptional regulator [Patescibacteria group bacterium]